MTPDEEAASAVRAVVSASEGYRLRAARSLGVGATEMAALFYLFTAGSSTPSELAGRLQITAASGTDLVERLSRACLVRRTTHPHDRRKVLISLTTSARTSVGDVLERIAVSTARCTSLLSTDERAGVLRFLHDLAIAYSATSPVPETGGAVLNP